MYVYSICAYPTCMYVHICIFILCLQLTHNQRAERASEQSRSADLGRASLEYLQQLYTRVLATVRGSLVSPARESNCKYTK